jgi:hypothetical protein
MVRKAATGLQRDFDAALAELRAIEAHARLLRWVDSQLDALQRAAQSGNIAAGDKTVAEWRRQMAEHMPPGLRPGDPMWNNYLKVLLDDLGERITPAKQGTGAGAKKSR